MSRKLSITAERCPGPGSSQSRAATRLAISDRISGFTLLEIILVLALIGIAAAILVPSVSSAFTLYHLERAAEDFQARLLHTRLQAMELGVPYAFTYRPNGDQFMVWACEPLDLTASAVGSVSVAAAAAVQSGDSYDRHTYELNDQDDNREFRFLSSSLGEALLGMGLSHEGRASHTVGSSADAAAASSLLSQQKMGLVTPSLRSTVALQIPGLQLGDVAEPLVFEPDGTADRDAIIRLADRSGRFVEITVHAVTGAITTSEAISIEELKTAQLVTVTSDQPRGFGGPSRSREVTGRNRGE